MATTDRIKVGALVLSASTLVGIAIKEAYRPVAYMPTPQDRPTLGFGETKGVKMGDTTTPERALVQLLASAQASVDGIKKCIKVPLYQYELDAYASFAYNVGVGAFCGLVVAVAGLVINVVYRHMHYRLAVKKATAWSPLGDGE